MNGYPDCSSPAQPQTNCAFGTAYGDDNNDCDVGNGSNTNNDSNGQPREMSFRCDGSPGQSGAPIYIANYDTCGTCALGNYNQFNCTAAACTTSFVNVMGKLTTSYASIIANLKMSFPD